MTKDIVLRIKAQIIGLNAEDYTTEQIRADDEGNAIPVELTEDEFIILKSDTSTRKTLLGRVEGKKILFSRRSR